MTLTTNISLVVSALLEQGEDLNSTLKSPVDFNLLRKLSSDEADLVWYKTNTVAGSATDTLDLTAALTDAFGNALAFDKVKILAIVADSANTADLLVGGGSFDTWLDGGSDTLVIQPGGSCFLIAPNAGYQVTPLTGNELIIENPSIADPATYNIIIVGSSA